MYVCESMAWALTSTPWATALAWILRRDTEFAALADAQNLFGSTEHMVQHPKAQTEAATTGEVDGSGLSLLLDSGMFQHFSIFSPNVSAVWAGCKQACYDPSFDVLQLPGIMFPACLESY